MENLLPGGKRIQEDYLLNRLEVAISQCKSRIDESASQPAKQVDEDFTDLGVARRHVLDHTTSEVILDCEISEANLNTRCMSVPSFAYAKSLKSKVVITWKFKMNWFFVTVC